MTCIVCKQIVDNPEVDVIVGKETTCEACLQRASENRTGLHGRGPQEWQRKVDEVEVEVEEHECEAKRYRGPFRWGYFCTGCGRSMHAPEPDWDAMAEARDEARGIER